MRVGKAIQRNRYARCAINNGTYAKNFRTLSDLALPKSGFPQVQQAWRPNMPFNFQKQNIKKNHSFFVFSLQDCGMHVGTPL